MKAGPSLVTAGLTVPEAFDLFFRSAVHQVTANWDLAAAHQYPAAIHQLRVGIRRLRTVLRMFRTSETLASARALNKRLGNLSRRLGETRDLDVLAADILPIHRGKGFDNGLDRLAAIIAAERAEKAKDLTVLLASPDARRLRQQLENMELARARYFDQVQAQQSLPKHARRTLTRITRRLEKRAALVDRATIAELHEIRKATKTLRYTFDFYAALYPLRRRIEFLTRLKYMQEIFGHLNDLTLASQIAAIAAAHPNDAELHHAAGYLTGYLAAQSIDIRADAHACWDTTRATKLFAKHFKAG